MTTKWKTGVPCREDDCDSSAVGRGWCVKHYRRWKKGGDPQAVTIRLDLPASERFWLRVDKSRDCWEWSGAHDKDGYSLASFDSRTRRAHRWVYEELVGPIPPGLVIDHLCRNRGCVNPDHMEPVTNKENLARGVSPSALAARVTHCPRGHPYEGDNLYIRKNGGRTCRTCAREQMRRSTAKRKLEASCR